MCETLCKVCDAEISNRFSLEGRIHWEKRTIKIQNGNCNDSWSQSTEGEFSV